MSPFHSIYFWLMLRMYSSISPCIHMVAITCWVLCGSTSKKLTILVLGLAIFMFQTNRHTEWNVSTRQ